jgi:hypothetical protein
MVCYPVASQRLVIYWQRFMGAEASVRRASFIRLAIGIRMLDF